MTVHNPNIDCPNCPNTGVKVHSANFGKVGPFAKDTKSECPECGHIWGYTNEGGERVEKVWKQGETQTTPIDNDRKVGAVPRDF